MEDLTLETEGTSTEVQPAQQQPAPRFPFVNLKKAMARAEKLYQDADDHEVLVADAFASWEYSAKSSGGFQTVGALKMYGLLQFAGSGDQRKVSLTPAALSYFRDERPEMKEKWLRQFALSPRLMRQLWEKWADKPPSDHIARSYLKIERHLVEQAARAALGIYKDNLEFAKLRGFPKAGPTIEGELSLGTVVEVDDSDEAPSDPLPSPPQAQAAQQQASRPLPLAQGERVLSYGVLSKTATYRVLVTGEVGAKEIDRLIRKLEVDKESFADEGGAAAGESEQA